MVTDSNSTAANTTYLNARGQPDSVKTYLADLSNSYWVRYYYDAEGILDSTKASGPSVSFLTRKYVYNEDRGTLDRIDLAAEATTLQRSRFLGQLGGLIRPPFWWALAGRPVYTPHRSVQPLSECLRPLSDFLACVLDHLLQRIQVEFAVVGDVDLQAPRAFGCQGLVRLCLLSTFRKRFLASF